MTAETFLKACDARRKLDHHNHRADCVKNIFSSFIRMYFTKEECPYETLSGLIEESDIEFLCHKALAKLEEEKKKAEAEFAAI